MVNELVDGGEIDEAVGGVGGVGGVCGVEDAVEDAVEEDRTMGCITWL